MKSKEIIFNGMKTIAAFCCAFLLSVGFAACSDKDDNNNSEKDPSQSEEVFSYDDLRVFQNSIIEVDENGNAVAHFVGEVLYEDDPLHLYVGVDSYEEAEAMFRQWIAPDVKLAATAPLTAQLTDYEGKAQGTVTFTKGESGHVAEVTVSPETDVKHFNKITFLLNSAWPFNAARPAIRVGDVIKAAVIIDGTFNLYDEDKLLNFVCIQEEKNGQKPIFIAITNKRYHRFGERVRYVDERGIFQTIRSSAYCPGLARAQAISGILRKRWEYFCVIVDGAGSGKLSNDGFWIDESHGFANKYDDYMYYSSGTNYGADTWWNDSDMNLPFLFKIDWMSESEVTVMLFKTAATDIPGHAETSEKLFDNSTTTKWYVQSGQKQNNLWFVEFMGNYASKPTGYKLYTGNDTETYTHRNPVAWKLYGKTREGDQWTLLDDRNSEQNPADAMPERNGAEKSFTFNKVSGGNYKFYRLEISKSKGNQDLQLSRFVLTY